MRLIEVGNVGGTLSSHASMLSNFFSGETGLDGDVTSGVAGIG